MSEDRLARAVFANRIAQRIARTGTGPSIVFGLAGPWGSGKTSMLNMIGEALGDISKEADTDAHRWSVAHFTPWSTSDIDSLITEFYTAIASALPRKAKKARKMLKSAAPVALAFGKKLGTAAIERWAPGGVDAALQAGADELADKLGTFNAPEDPFQIRFNKISEAIQETGTRVLVVVDDLDRLHADELLAVMKAVRLLGRFPNVHYLLSYDRTTVLDLLTSSDLARDNRDRAHHYLEKIVQYPFLLPPIQRTHIKNELHEGLLTVAGNLGLDPDTSATEYAVQHLIRALPDPGVLTLRSIKQLCVQTDVLCSMVGPEEIDLFDAAVLTYIRLNYPDLYEGIQTWQPMLVALDNRATGAAEGWLARVRTTVARVRTTVARDTSDEAVVAIYRMLVALFPRLPHHQGTVWASRTAACRISNPDYFGRYFQFAIPEDDLSDVEVREAFSQLVRRGRLGPNSIISRHLSTPTRQRRRLMTKIHNSLDVIDGSAPDTSADAARWVTRSLPDLDPAGLRFDWGTVIFGILTHAVATAPTDEDTGRMLNDYCNEFGLGSAAVILTHHRVRNAPPGARLSVAVRSIREQVVQACLRDLQTPSAPPGENILSFSDLMDDTMWAQVRAALQGSGISQQSIAARFVSIQRRPDTEASSLDHFYDDLFLKVIPSEEFDLSGFDNPSALDMNDVTINGRELFAAYTLRRAQPPHTASLSGNDPD